MGENGGLRVRHDLEDFEKGKYILNPGQEYVLNLKDTSVLEGASVSNGITELENQLLQENFRAKTKLADEEKGPAMLAKYDKDKNRPEAAEGIQLNE